MSSPLFGTRAPTAITIKQAASDAADLEAEAAAQEAFRIQAIADAKNAELRRLRDFERSLRAAGSLRSWSERTFSSNGFTCRYSKDRAMESPGRFRQTVTIRRGLYRMKLVFDTRRDEGSAEAINTLMPEFIDHISELYPVR